MTLLDTRHGELTQRFLASRALTERLAAPLSPEDQTAQSMPDCSPTKWHRAHTSWFYEEFVLRADVPGSGYDWYDASFRYLFNSYYEAVGPRHPRPERGLVTRPGAAEVGAYRDHVERAVAALLEQDPARALRELVELGINHEQQHQELLVMDAKHLLSKHAFGPALIERVWPGGEPSASSQSWKPRSVNDSPSTSRRVSRSRWIRSRPSTYDEGYVGLSCRA